MARIRSVKPELRRDLTVAEWPREVRYAWVLLFGYLDDHGRGLDDLRLLTADLFPLDRDVSERKLDGWLSKMAAESEWGSPPLCRYTVDGRRYLHAPKWKRSQRVSHPQDSQLPPCPLPHPLPNGSGTDREPNPNDSENGDSAFRTSRTPEDLGSKGAREQGSKGVAPPSSIPEPAPGKPATKRRTAIPDTWPPDDDTRSRLASWASERTPAVDLRRETERWQDWHRAKGDTAADWPASWRTWIGKAQADIERHQPGRGLALVHPPRPSASEAAAQAALDAGARVAARHAANERPA